MAAAPFFLVWLALLICKMVKVNFVFIYKIINFDFIIFINMIFGGAEAKITDISYGSIFICLLFVVIIPVLGYIAYNTGYRQLSLMEKLIYKNLPKKKPKADKKK